MKNRILCFLVLILLLWMGSACAESAGGWIASREDLNGKRMGIVTGTSFEAPTLQYFPDSQYLYFSTNSDVVTALTNNKIDGFLADEPVIRMICKEVPEITYLSEKITQDDYAFGFAKNSERADKIRDQFNEMLSEIMADGALNALYEKWFGDDEAVKVVDLTGFSGENGTLNVVTNCTNIPFSYIKDGKMAGIAIELTEMFCRRYGYTPSIEDVDAAARIPGIVTGKYDMCAAPLTITEERRESINFSDPYYQGGIVLAVRKADAPAQTAQSAQGTASTLDALNGKRVGVQTGTICGPLVEAAVANAQVSYFNSQTDLLAALKARKIDAWCHDEPVIRFLSIDNPEVKILDRYLAESNLAAIFPKTEAGQTLRDQYSAFVEKLWADGTMREIDGIWFGTDEGKRTVLDYEALPASNGTLRMAVDTSTLPFAYIKENRVVGYDVDIAARFCQEYGYRLETVQMSFDGVLAAVQSGKCDFAACCITITEERAESMLFSSPNYYGGIALAVLDEGGSAPRQDGGISFLSELNGKRIGVATGTTFDAIVLKAMPEAELVYINSSADLIAALESGKIDGFAVDEPAAKQFCSVNPRLTIVDEYLDTFDFGIVLPKTAKGEALLKELNAWLVPMKESGALERVIEKWADGPEEEKTLPDYAAFPSTKGTLTLATEGDYVPMTYYRGTEIVGAEIDLIAQFCEANGYGLKVQVMNFEGILPAVQTGKADFAAAGISITDERRESVNFSVPYYSGGTVMVVLKSELTTAVRTQGTITSFADLEHARIGVMTGSIQVLQAEERFPDAELFYFTTDVDMLNALWANKIDAYASAEVLVRTMMKENADLTYLDGWLGDGMKAAAIFPKTESGQALCDQFSTFIREIRQNGAYEEIQEIWFGEDEAQQVIPDLYDLPSTNGTLRMATDTSIVPFVYIKDGKPVGIEIDTVVRFCKEYGYGLEVVPMDFSGVIPSVVTGKVDFASCGIAITEERAESVLFSEPTYETGSVLAVLKTEETVAPAEENTSFWDGIVSSFNKTFIRENRWELFGNGVLTTLLITVLSILFGTALGFSIFMLCRNGNIVANGATRFSMWLVQGMPMVVLLMILYYIIFGSVAISGIFVAVIGFTLTFGASVFGLLKMGVGTIDRGQYEAAYALGYANRRTFFRIILPQAIPHILPAYKGEIVGLIKATAIVGYIAVQDLTKMGDIVRSRTYEAFFPLIAVTVIYFVLEGLLGFLVSKIQIRMNPKKRKPVNILKGVNLHD